MLALALQLHRKMIQRFCLTERLAARERHTLDERIAAHILQQRVQLNILTALKVVRLRVVTARTAVRTALHKQRIAEAGAVHNGLPDCTCNANFTFHQAVCS